MRMSLEFVYRLKSIVNLTLFAIASGTFAFVLREDYHLTAISLTLMIFVAVGLWYVKELAFGWLDRWIGKEK